MKKNDFEIFFLTFLCACGMWLIQYTHAQLPAGTVRKTAETDANGNFLWPSNLVGVVSGQWKIVNAPSHAQHIARHQDLTNTVAGATNGMYPGSLLTNGSIPMGAPINLGGFKGTNALDGTDPKDIATYGQTTNLITGSTNTLISLNNKWTGTSNTFTNAVSAKTVSATSNIVTEGIMIASNARPDVVDFPQWASAPPAPSTGRTRMYGMTDDGFVVLETISEAGIIRRVNQDLFRIAKNDSGTSISTGKAVYFSGSTGNKPNFRLAQSNASTNMPAIGMSTATVADGNFGQIMLIGRLTGLKTDYTGWTEGQSLYVDPVTPGGLTNGIPVHPNYAQWVGTVEVVSSSAGVILVNIQAQAGIESGTDKNSFTIGDGLTGVKTIKVDGTNDSILQWSSSNSVWSFNSGTVAVSNNFQVFGAQTNSDGLTVNGLFTSTNASIARPHITLSSTNTVVSAGTTSSNVVEWTQIEASYLCSTSSATRVTLQQPGYYIAFPSVMIKNGTTEGGSFNVWLRQNGTNVTRSGTSGWFPAVSGGGIITNCSLCIAAPLSFMVNTAGEYVELLWWSDNATVSVFESPVGASPPRSQSPAVIMEIYKQSSQ